MHFNETSYYKELIASKKIPSISMDLQRKIRAIANKIGPSPGKPPAHQATNSNQGLATLIVMILVLTIIILFCCFAAPGVRDLCRRYIFRNCPMDDPSRDNVTGVDHNTPGTPTIILLPYGRMLVVDHRMLSELHRTASPGAANTTPNTTLVPVIGGSGGGSSSIDFVELSVDLIQATQLSHPQYLVSSTTPTPSDSKVDTCFPPAYQDLFKSDTQLNSQEAVEEDLPPSYSEANLLLNESVRRTNAERHERSDNNGTPTNEDQVRESHI